MSTEEPFHEEPVTTEDGAGQMQEDTHPAPGRKRPRLDLAALAGGKGDRKRGKSMFGVLVNTLNKAKAEDKERNASDAAKKRQLIEQRLQNKLKKETDSVRRAEEAKKDRISASRKEEDLQLKDSIHKLRRTRFPHLSNFLSTSDVIPDADADPEPIDSFSLNTLIPPRTRPPPLLYLPAKLLSSQEAFLARRRTQAKEAAEQEWEQFKSERTEGVEEIMQLRKRVAADMESQQKLNRMEEQQEEDPAITKSSEQNGEAQADDKVPKDVDVEMDIEEPSSTKTKGDEEMDAEKKEERTGNGGGLGGDDDDAVEY